MVTELDGVLARSLAAHGGLLTRDEAHALGVSNDGLRRQVSKGTLVPLHPDVFAAPASAAHPLVVVRAAVLAAGEGAMASHRSAAWLWGWVERPWPVEVTITHRGGARLAGVTVHRSRLCPAAARRRGVACTDAITTLIDCAATGSERSTDGMLDRALAAGHVALPRLWPAVAAARGRGRRGPPRLARCLRRRGLVAGPKPSVLESRMARLLAASDLPAPKAECRWGPDGEYRLDFAFPGRVAVEVDGYAWHSSPEQMRRDRQRRNALARAGWTVLVYTWVDVTRAGAQVVAEIAAALARGPTGRDQAATC